MCMCSGGEYSVDTVHAPPQDQAEVEGNPSCSSTGSQRESCELAENMAAHAISAKNSGPPSFSGVPWECACNRTRP